jgi:type IV pilus assembly protein PilW
MKRATMERLSLQRPRGQRGVTLVELMVALAIGLMTILAIVQLMSSFGREQRLNGSINDVQSSALIALNTMTQDLQRAGHSLSHKRLQECATFKTFYNGAALADFSTAAVSIVDGGTGPDTVRIRYAESVRGDAPVVLGSDMPDTVAALNIRASDGIFGIRVNDLVLVTNTANDCTLRQVTALDTGSPLRLRAEQPASPFNPTLLTVPVGWVAYAADSLVFTLGNLTQRSYSVDPTARVLSTRELLTPDQALAEDIIDLQAQYGVTVSAASDSVTEWVNATGATWANPGPAARKRIKAIRIAVMARTAEADSGDPSTDKVVLWPAATTGQISSEQAFTPTGDARRYRYRVLRTVVPLKNLLWADFSP